MRATSAEILNLFPTKRCTTCHEEKPHSEFYSYANICKACRAVYNREYLKTHPRKYAGRRKEVQLKSEKKRRAAAVESIKAYKLRKGCCLCGYKKCASALEFHHVDGDKKFELSKHRNFNKSTMAEIEKCAVLCANCHREVHAGDFPLLNPKGV